jgi:FMN-dependent NADH-azoreductase
MYSSTVTSNNKHADHQQRRITEHVDAVCDEYASAQAVVFVLSVYTCVPNEHVYSWQAQ